MGMGIGKRWKRLMSGREEPRPAAALPADYDERAQTIIRHVTPYTMIGHERLYSLIQATRYIARHGIPGAVVECGVWRGGAVGAVGMVLQDEATERPLYLFDTFEGMSQPSQADQGFDGSSASAIYRHRETGDGGSDWCRSPLEDVQATLLSLGLAPEGFVCVKGKVEDTIPSQFPEPEIALLRLDTDWYESTRHEMEHLFPRLVAGGVLIIDDYGDWMGARKAVDEYLAAHRVPMLLNRVNGSVIGVKPAGTAPAGGRQQAG